MPLTKLRITLVTTKHKKGVDYLSFSKRLSNVLKNAYAIPFDDNSRIIIMSDCHRGIGNWGDNFLGNQNIFFAALYYYYENGYTYIELGDGDELWENRSIEDIIQAHNDTFWLLSLFYKKKRLYMIYGNHDIIKRNPKYTQTKCREFFCDNANSYIALFPGIQIPEAILLTNIYTNDTILLTHGHQADFLNDRLSALSGFLVRYLWRPLELIGIKDPTSAAKNNTKKNKIEKRLAEWSRKNRQFLICGHTHRPVFPKVGESLYFNDGSCIHPRCITGIEIQSGTISLVKWAIMTRPDRSLYVGREVLEGPVRLSDYFMS